MAAPDSKPRRYGRLPVRAERWLRRLLRPLQYRLLALSPADWSFIESTHDASAPLPAGAAEDLRSGHPRLRELRAAYAALDWPPVRERSVWSSARVETWVDLRHFRGENPYIWHYREQRALTALKYFLYLKYLLERDSRGLLKSLVEDGAFGCWTFGFEGYPRVSRDLLDSVNELYFLDRHLSLFDRPGQRVLDIGAGYGRLAHRMSRAAPGLGDYCCVDAIPESTFLCEYYTRFRGCTPPVRVVPLPGVTQLAAGSFDLAVNIHSFSEVPYAAIAWWLEQLQRLRVPNLLIVPNQPRELLSSEADRSKRDFAPLVKAAGYEQVVCEPAVTDAATRELLGVHDHFFLFRARA